MPNYLLSLRIKPSFKGTFLLRLIESDEDFYLSCWHWPARVDFGEQEPHEDFETGEIKNWKVPLEKAEVEAWYQVLEYQKISIIPPSPNCQVRDGTSYQLELFSGCGGRSILRWNDELPESWAALAFIVQRMHELAHIELE